MCLRAEMTLEYIPVNMLSISSQFLLLKVKWTSGKYALSQSFSPRRDEVVINSVRIMNIEKNKSSIWITRNFSVPSRCNCLTSMCNTADIAKFLLYLALPYPIVDGVVHERTSFYCCPWINISKVFSWLCHSAQYKISKVIVWLTFAREKSRYLNYLTINIR